MVRSEEVAGQLLTDETVRGSVYPSWRQFT